MNPLLWKKIDSSILSDPPSILTVSRLMRPGHHPSSQGIWLAKYHSVESINADQDRLASSTKPHDNEPSVRIKQ